MDQYESWKTRERRQHKSKLTPINDEADRISDLPVFLAHRILSCLRSQAEVTRISVLSTRWNTIVASFPELEFHQSDHLNPHNSDYLAQCHRFTSYFRESLSRFLSLNLRIHRFSLELESLNNNDPELPSSVDTWIGPVLRSGASEITVSISLNHLDSIFYSLPETTFHGQTFNFLQTLCLSHVTISEEIISDIVRNCPKLSAIGLFQCEGFKNVAISGLKKLERVEIVAYMELKKVEIFAESLQTLRLWLPRLINNEGNCTVTLGPCPNLRDLALSNLSLNDEWFGTNLLRLSQLEELEIVDCHELKRVRIPAVKSLKSLMVRGCDNMERVELDSPNLNDFMLHCYKIPVLVTNVDNAKCDRLKVGFWPRDNNFPVNSSWFRRLRQFLAMSSNIQTKTITLLLHLRVNEVTFEREELGEAKIGEPHEIDEIVVSLGKKATSVDCGALIDGLLWSCHPKRISFDKRSYSLENILKVFGEKLFDRERRKCCVAECQLKSVEIILQRYDRQSGISLENLLQRLSSVVWKDNQIIYKLSWGS